LEALEALVPWRALARRAPQTRCLVLAHQLPKDVAHDRHYFKISFIQIEHKMFDKSDLNEFSYI
jgi:hypothetical protein